MQALKDFVRARPALYDRVRGLKRSVLGAQDPSFIVLDEFSRARDGRVNFIQIGANDGLRNDPVRPLIVRDDWQGVLVEPLPTVFPLLKQNYAYLKRPQLVFLNAAVTAGDSTDLTFWTFCEAFLAAQTLEARLDFLRKASFDRDHVARFLPGGIDPAAALESVAVPCLDLAQVVRDHLPREPLHLLVIDAEGYESTLIPGIDFAQVTPDAVFFESEHLAADRERVFDHLRGFGYTFRNVGLDTLAVR